MTGNTMPVLDIVFKGLGASAVARGERGAATLIVKDDTTANYFKKYETIDDFTSEEQAKFTTENQKFIKDALEGIPLELYVAATPKDVPALADTLADIKGRIPRNSWVTLASDDATEQQDIATWIKSQRKNNKKRYKAVTYKAVTTDDIGIVNVTTEKVWEALTPDVELTGDHTLPFIMGYLAGLPLSISAIAKPITKYDRVKEPEDLDDAISNGEFVLFNDEGIVKVARGVNSLVTLGENVTQEMSFINTVEKMDQIYCDIFKAWDESYKGKYNNILDNQQLLISAINAYFAGLALDNILDPNFDNKSEVDIDKQRLANYSKYGEETVKAWSDTKALQMTYSTQVYLMANIKISGIMEDFWFDIYM